MVGGHRSSSPYRSQLQVILHTAKQHSTIYEYTRCLCVLDIHIRIGRTRSPQLRLLDTLLNIPNICYHTGYDISRLNTDVSSSC